jgi:hypothetical protein
VAARLWIIPTIGRRARFLRCAERVLAGVARPARCRCTPGVKPGGQRVAVPLGQVFVEMPTHAWLPEEVGKQGPGGDDG